jgi:hypothetical protein
MPGSPSLEGDNLPPQDCSDYPENPKNRQDRFLRNTMSLPVALESFSPGVFIENDRQILFIHPGE